MRVDSKYLNNYELVKENYNNQFPFSLLHYAIMFRRFSEVDNIIKNSKNELKELLFKKSTLEGYEWVTPMHCIEWNKAYFSSYCEKYNSDMLQKVSIYFRYKREKRGHNILTYDDYFDENKTIFQIFFDNRVPLLDIVYYEKQSISSRQLINNNYSFVLDEVGTGKTVTALYSIRNIIEQQEKRNDKAKILIISPSNKRNDWQDDIRRQLGRYSHVVEQSDNGLMYNNELKRAYFKEKEHIIIICGQRQSQTNKDGSSSALKGNLERWNCQEDWDLIIIDEVHCSFNNYQNLKTKKMLLLTATPIVVNSKEVRDFSDYKFLMSNCTDTRSQNWNDNINPLSKTNPNEKDIFVNWFKEDYGIQSAERKISFIECKRHSERIKWTNFIESKKKILTALQYDQDDEYLFEKAKRLVEQLSNNGEINQEYLEVPSIKVNYKIEELVKLLYKSDKSYIIFCEHKFVMGKIYTRLRNEFQNTIIGYKSGKEEVYSGLSGVPQGQLVNSLIQNIRIGNRVLLITTGKTGGTGLNLGEFDGVIHYELPFTSIELEQRFGRVDRLDTKIGDNEKDMIFLLNETESDINDAEVNRMLYYCSTKIDITSKYMPIRNTVLFYPQFVKRNKINLIEALLLLKASSNFQDKNVNYINDNRKDINSLKTKIFNELSWGYHLENNKKNIYVFSKEKLNSKKEDDIDKKTYKMMVDFVAKVEAFKEENEIFSKYVKEYNSTLKSVKRWLGVLGIDEIDYDDQKFIFQYIENEKEEYNDETNIEITEDTEINNFENDFEDSDFNNEMYEDSELEDDEKQISTNKYIKEIDKYLKLLDKIDNNYLKYIGLVADGVFYFDCKKDKIVRKTLGELREVKG